MVCLCQSGWVWILLAGGWRTGGCIHSLLDGEKCSAAEMHSKVFFGGGGEAARVPRLSGSLAGLRLWLGRGLMAGKERRVYRGLAAEGPNRSEKRKRPCFFFSLPCVLIKHAGKKENHSRREEKSSSLLEKKEAFFMSVRVATCVCLVSVCVWLGEACSEPASRSDC